MPAGDIRHPLYISVTEINHNAKDKTLEISVKIFTNDFEAALEKTGGGKVDLSTSSGALDKLVAAYVGKHLRLRVDGKAAVLSYVGRENKEDGTWSYFQVDGVAEAPHKIEAVDDLLYETYSQQINIMHVTVGGMRKSTRLDCPEGNANFVF